MSGEALRNEDLHLQVFSEQRSGMSAGMPELIVKATHLPTGLSAYGCGERSQHANRSKALEALGTAVAGRTEVDEETHRIAGILQEIEKAKDVQQGAVRACDNVEVQWQEARIAALKNRITHPRAGDDAVAWIEPISKTVRVYYSAEEYQANKDMLDKHGWRPLVYGDAKATP